MRSIQTPGSTRAGGFLLYGGIVNIGCPTAGRLVSKTGLGGSTPPRPGPRWPGSLMDQNRRLLNGSISVRVGVGSRFMVEVAQMARVSDCESEGYGFDAHPLPQLRPVAKTGRHLPAKQTMREFDSRLDVHHRLRSIVAMPAPFKRGSGVRFPTEAPSGLCSKRLALEALQAMHGTLNPGSAVRFRAGAPSMLSVRLTAGHWVLAPENVGSSPTLTSISLRPSLMGGAADSESEGSWFEARGRNERHLVQW